MRVAIRFSEYKGAGKLPHREKFDCSACMFTAQQEKRNCRGEFGKKFQYTIGTMQFYQCPVSVFAFDHEVTQVIDIVVTSLESGIPVTGNCLLDQTPAFFEYARIIRDERRICSDELKKIFDDEQKKTAAQARRQAAPRMPRRR